MSLRPVPSRDFLIERYGEPDDIAQDDSNPSNKERAGWALAAVNAFAALVHRNPAEQHYEIADLADDNGVAVELIGDLIANLLQLGVMVGEDADDLVQQGLSHFTAEVGMGYEL